jgi:hypothetical protein
MWLNQLRRPAGPLLSYLSRHKLRCRELQINHNEPGEACSGSDWGSTGDRPKSGHGRHTSGHSMGWHSLRHDGCRRRDIVVWHARDTSNTRLASVASALLGERSFGKRIENSCAWAIAALLSRIHGCNGLLSGRQAHSSARACSLEGGPALWDRCLSGDEPSRRATICQAKEADDNGWYGGSAHHPRRFCRTAHLPCLGAISSGRPAPVMSTITIAVKKQDETLGWFTVGGIRPLRFVIYDVSTSERVLCFLYNWWVKSGYKTKVNACLNLPLNFC